MQFITLPNVLSLLRLLSAFVFVVLWHINYYSIAIFILFLMVISDFLDGWLARYYGQVTFVGKLLDPLADKVMLNLLGIVLFSFGVLPGWFTYFNLCKDLLLILGTIWLIYTNKHYCHSISSILVAKFSTMLLMLLFSWWFLNFWYYETVFKIHSIMIDVILYVVLVANLYAVVLYVVYYYMSYLHDYKSNFMS